MTPRIIRPNAGFIIPTRRFVDVGVPASNVGMSGRYQLIVRDAWGVEKRRTPWFDNIILDSGLNRIGTATAIAGAAIGTGTSTPLASQTGLDTESHWTTTNAGASTSALGSSPYNNTYTRTYRTVLGSLNGNYSEVGVGWATGQMFSRALILDGGGSPTTISIGIAEQLDIVYQLSIYPPLADIAATVNISGVDYDVAGRAANVNSTSGWGGWTPSNWGASAVAVSNIGSWNNAWNGGLGLITSAPSGSANLQGGSALLGSYVDGSLTRAGRSTYDLGHANLAGGLKSCVFAWNGACFQYEFTPAIPKDGTKTLKLDFSMSWARRP